MKKNLLILILTIISSVLAAKNYKVLSIKNYVTFYKIVVKYNHEHILILQPNFEKDRQNIDESYIQIKNGDECHLELIRFYPLTPDSVTNELVVALSNQMVNLAIKGVYISSPKGKLIRNSVRNNNREVFIPFKYRYGYTYYTATNMKGLYIDIEDIAKSKRLK